MTIEMDRPFVWPSMPKSLEMWGRAGQHKDSKKVPFDQVSQAERMRENQMLKEQVNDLMGWKSTKRDRVQRLNKLVAPGESHADRVLKRWTERRTVKHITVDNNKGYKIRV